MPELLKSFLRIAQETYHCAFGQFGAHERKTGTGGMQNCSVSGAKSVRVLTYAVGRKVTKGALFDRNFAAFYFWRGEASNGQRLQSQYHSVLGIRLSRVVLRLY